MMCSFVIKINVCQKVNCRRTQCARQTVCQKNVQQGKAEHRKKDLEAQGGFRKGRSCIDQIVTVRQLNKCCWRMGIEANGSGVFRS